MKRAAVVFGAAVVLALSVGHLARDTPGFAVRGADGTLHGDIDHYVYWTRLVTLGGIQDAYSGTWPETYAVYPPVTLYAYQVVGTAYRLFEDPAFDPERAQHSLFVRQGIKLAGLGWHVLTGAAIFALVAGRHRGWAAALFVANPAALYDVAHWGQPDGAHSLFSVLAVGLLDAHAVLAWCALAVAVLAKPQAVAIVPVIVLATLRSGGLPELLRPVLAAAAVSLVVILPFIVTGRLGELLTLPSTVGSVMPVASADAHNLWWLALSQRGLDPLTTPDATRLLGPLSIRLIAGGLVVLGFAFSCWLYWTRRARLAEAAAMAVLGWFAFTTQAHENHLFFALPLLSLAWPQRPSLLWVYATLSVTILANMVLHDQLVLEGLGLGLDDALVVQLRLVNSAINLVCLAAWAISAALRVPEGTDVRVATERRPALLPLR